MLPRKVLPLAGAISVIGANSLALSPIAAAVAASFPAADAAGVMMAAATYGLATAISALALAPAIDRIGAQAVLVRALSGLMAALALSAFAPSLVALCAAQALAGLAAGCALPAVYALSAQVAEKGRESETLGMVLTGWTVSLVVGVGLSALLADLAHWRVVFGALAVAASGLALQFRRRSGAAPSTPSRRHSSSPRSALRVRGMAPALMTVAAYMTAFYGLYAYLGAHFAGALQLSTTAAGVAAAAYGIGFGAAVPLDRLLDRYGKPAVAPFAFLGLALVYAAMAAASADAALLITACLAWGVCNHVGLNLIVGRLTALDPAQQGAIMGLYSAVTYLAVSAGALLYRPIFEHAGFTGCALMSAGCIAPAFAAALHQARRSSTPTRRDQDVRP